MQPERLAPDLRLALARIEPTLSYYERLWRWPCKVWMRSGEIQERVLITQLKGSDQDVQNILNSEIAATAIKAGDIVRIKDCPQRLPARFANALYLEGESGMGYFSFTVSFYLTGTQLNCVAGNSVDFIPYPPLTFPRLVRSIGPGLRDQPWVKCPTPKMCFIAE